MDVGAPRQFTAYQEWGTPMLSLIVLYQPEGGATWTLVVPRTCNSRRRRVVRQHAGSISPHRYERFIPASEQSCESGKHRPAAISFATVAQAGLVVADAALPRALVSKPSDAGSNPAGGFARSRVAASWWMAAGARRRFRQGCDGSAYDVGIPRPGRSSMPDLGLSSTPIHER